MINLFKVAMSPDAGENLDPVLKSGYIGQGPQVERFEDALQGSLRVNRRPLTTNSCTSALDLAMHCAGIGPGDLVLTTPITCLATNTTIHNRGATIAWVDVDPITGNMSPEDLEVCLSLYPEVKAVVTVDWAGRPSVTAPLYQVVAKDSFSSGKNLPIIEDAAHSFAATYEGQGLDLADYVCWSFQAIKHLTTGDGGALLCPPAQYERAKLLRWYGLDRTSGTAMRCTQILPEVGYKYQMNDIAATIGLANLDLARANVAKHRKNAAALGREIANPLIDTPPADDESAWWIYTVSVKDPALRDPFMKHCLKEGVEASLVHARNDMQPKLRITNGHKLPGVDYFANHEASIPCGWWMTPEDVSYVASVVNAFRP